jgi:hypothetical protein
MPSGGMDTGRGEVAAHPESGLSSFSTGAAAVAIAVGAVLALTGMVAVRRSRRLTIARMP